MSGAAGRTVPESIASVKTGGAGGGGGTAPASALGLPLLLVRVVMSVREDESLLDEPGVYSQHGSTMWPEGAVSNGKVSLPGGSPCSTGMSPWSTEVQPQRAEI